jgi:hypothetical protein
MGESIPPVSKSQPAAARDAGDPHETVTIAPPAPDFDALLGLRTPLPSAPGHDDQHLRTALDAGARAGTTLSELSKMVAELSGGVVGAKRVNEQLLHELTTLRGLLGATNAQQAQLRQRVAELEEEVAVSREEAERERQFLTSQHDDFVAALIEEHEEALDARVSARATANLGAGAGDLARQLVQAESARADAEAEQERARAAMNELRAERDEARARAEKRERERDELRAEASLLRARLGTSRNASTAPPPPLGSPRPPSYRPPPALRLDAGELDSMLHARPSRPRLPGIARRATPPPAELESTHSESSESTAAFPRVSTRPGVGGPKPTDPPPSFGPAPTGWTPPPPPPSENEHDASTTPPAVSPKQRESAFQPPRRVISAASLPPDLATPAPALKQKPDATTRPLISYSLGHDGVRTETLEGARISSKPPKK